MWFYTILQQFPAFLLKNLLRHLETFITHRQKIPENWRKFSDIE